MIEPMQSLVRKALQRAKPGSWMGRLPIYVVGFAVTFAIDSVTPLGTAEWLIALLLVYIAAIRGSAVEGVVVAGVGSACTLAGLWTSPPNGTPFWLDALNRLGAVAVMWAVVYVARGRRKAETQVRILQGLLPICAGCKRIRHGDDEWQHLESYISAHSEARFTHTLCPVCLERFSEPKSD